MLAACVNYFRIIRIVTILIFVINVIIIVIITVSLFYVTEGCHKCDCRVFRVQKGQFGSCQYDSLFSFKMFFFKQMEPEGTRLKIRFPLRVCSTPMQWFLTKICSLLIRITFTGKRYIVKLSFCILKGALNQVNNFYISLTSLEMAVLYCPYITPLFVFQGLQKKPLCMTV